MATSMFSPINELKRRLDDNVQPLPKRFCLAKNALTCMELPPQRDPVIIEWLDTINNTKGKECIKNILKWFDNINEPSTVFLDKVIEILINYFSKANQPDAALLKDVLNLLEHDKLFNPEHTNISSFLKLIESILLSIKIKDTDNTKDHIIISLLDVVENFHKRIIRKAEFTTKLIENNVLAIIFKFYKTNFKSKALEFCKNILFSASKQGYYMKYIQTVLTAGSLDDLIKENGEKILTAKRILDVLMLYPKNKDHVFVENYVETFVYSYKHSSPLISLFYIILLHTIDIKQDVLQTDLSTNPIYSEEKLKIKKKIFLSCLQYLNSYDIDLNIALHVVKKPSDPKKQLNVLIKSAVMNLLNNDFKADIVTMRILKTALTLDPSIEGKVFDFIPKCMGVKKLNRLHTEALVELLDTIFELQFKLSKGTEILAKILPSIKKHIEPLNTEQFELRQKLIEYKNCPENYEKIKSKILDLEDILPEVSIEKYGALCSKLLFRQENEILCSLQREFEINCILMLEDGFVSPSVLLISEMLSSLLCSVLEHSRMCDHSVPEHISSEFSQNYNTFEREVLGKLGECAVKLSYKTQLVSSFTRMAVSCGRLKLLNARYSNVTLTFDVSVTAVNDVFDLSALLPCLSAEKWRRIADKIKEGDESKLIEDMNMLVLQKLILLQTLKEAKTTETDAHILAIKIHLLKEINVIWYLLETTPYFADVLFADLNQNLGSTVAKSLMKMALKKPELTSIFDNKSVSENKCIMKGILFEILRKILKFLEGNGVGLKPSLCKSLGDDNFDFVKFTKQLVDVTEYFENLSALPEDPEDLETIEKCLTFAKKLKLFTLDENCQLLIIFALLAMKKATKRDKKFKKIVKIIDNILLNLFEMTAKAPDIYKIFPVNYVIAFGDNCLIDLATLKLKSPNKMLPISCFLRAAVKKVKTQNDVIKEVVTILLSDQKSVKKVDKNLSFFSNDVFQITCMLLPMIAKEKKFITTSNYRSILADLQEKLHKSLLKSFKNVKFDFEVEDTSEIINAIDSYTLLLVRYSESLEDANNLEIVLENLDYFAGKALSSLQDTNTKPIHVNSSLQLINATLRNYKKLENRPIFTAPDTQKKLWSSLKARIVCAAEQKFMNVLYVDELSLCVKFFVEMSSIDFFTVNILNDLNNMAVLKAPSQISSEIKMCVNRNNHESLKFTTQSILKSNITGEKSGLLSKLIIRLCKGVSMWLKTHYLKVDGDDYVDDSVVRKLTVDDGICDILRLDLECIAEMVLAAKKVTSTFKCLDALFEVLHSSVNLINCQINCQVSYEMSNQSYFDIFDAIWVTLNNLLLSRSELLEDRWPCYLKIYRMLVTSLCLRSKGSEGFLERVWEEKMAETALAVEKLTQTMMKKKQQVSHLAAYLIADLCYLLETTPPSRKIRQNLENCVIYLIQTSESAKHSMAFLKRALAETNGVATLINMNTVYKRYHKYSGMS